MIVMLCYDLIIMTMGTGLRRCTGWERITSENHTQWLYQFDFFHHATCDIIILCREINSTYEILHICSYFTFSQYSLCVTRYKQNSITKNLHQPASTTSAPRMLPRLPQDGGFLRGRALLS